MDSIITDGLYCPGLLITAPPSVGGAPPPCPDPPIVEELVPEICDIDVDCDC